MSLPFDPEKGLIVVRAHLWGPKRDSTVRMALDTGSTGTVLSWEIAVLRGYDPAAVRNRVRMTTGSGVEYAPRLAIKRIDALNRTRRSFPTVCHTFPPSASIDGLLGLDFFRETRLVLDFRVGTIAVE